jgi:PKD repeat protein
VVLLLFLFFLSGIAAAAPIVVTLSADPASIPAGGSTSLVVTTTMSGNPLENADVVITAPGCTIAPSSGKTGTTGTFGAVLTASPSASGPVAVTADVTYTPLETAAVPLDSHGSGSTVITVIPVTTATTVTPQAGAPEDPVGIIAADSSAGSAPFTVRFDGTGSYDPDGSVSAYSWTFGDGSYGTGYAVSHTYGRAGTYSAGLVVTDNDGRTSLPVSLLITVESSPAAGTGMPVAVIAANRSTGPPPLAVAFDGTGSYDPSGETLAYHWDFGDGSSAEGARAGYTYQETGSFLAVLHVTARDGRVSKNALLQILAGPPAPAATPAPGRTAAPMIARQLTPEPTDTPLPSPRQVPVAPAAGLLPAGAGLLHPVLGTASGIILGALAALVTRSKPGDPAGRKLQEFVRTVLGRRGIGLLAAWERAKGRLNVTRRREVVAGLSAAEILVSVASAILIGCAFCLLGPAPENIISSVLVFTAVGGISVVANDLARRQAARRHGCYGEYQLWPAGTAIMFLTAGIFACACGKPSRPVFEPGQARAPRDLALECLSGPAASVLFAGLFALLIPLGGWLQTAGTAGVSVNILLALYSLMPFRPMEGQDIWSWNRAVYLAIFIPLLVLYIGIAYLV